MAPREQLLQRVSDLVDQGLETGLQVPQDTGLLNIDGVALDQVVELVEGTVEALAEVAEACDAGLELDDPDVSLPPQQLGDLAYVARAELLELRASLQKSIDNDSKWQIAAKADRASGRSVRALLPVESALREYCGLESMRRRWFDLDDTLAIRRRFVRFWLEAKRIDQSSDDGLQPALERVAMMIGDLRQDKIYPFLRLEDRLDLRALQKRILAWLQDAQKGVDADARSDGHRLRQDASGFFNLLMQIQRREELREHDLLLVGRVLSRLQDDAGGTLDSELRGQLLDLAAREGELDMLLIAEEPAPLGDVEKAVRKVHKQLLQR